MFVLIYFLLDLTISIEGHNLLKSNVAVGRSGLPALTATPSAALTCTAAPVAVPAAASDSGPYLSPIRFSCQLRTS